MPALLTFYEVYPRSLEEWLDGFRRDANPESEVQWWERLARCYTTYNQTNSLTGDQKQALFRILFMAISALYFKTMADAESSANALGNDAFGSGLPSAARGIPGVGRSSHWAPTGTATSASAATAAQNVGIIGFIRFIEAQCHRYS